MWPTRSRRALSKTLTKCVWLCGLAAFAANACGNGPVSHNRDGGQAGRAGGGGTAGTAGQGGYGGQWPPPCNLPAWCFECGNGVHSFGESCDDGNSISGDGCNRICQVEASWECPEEGPCWKGRLCGDGVVALDEICDDGNSKSGDGCSADCHLIEPGWFCPAPGKGCRPDRRAFPAIDAGAVCDGGGSCAVCGNGIVEPGEDCDDGIDPSAELHNEDGLYGGCTTACKLGPYCGDGIVNGSEGCDLASDNGVVHHDGIAGEPSYCSSACTVAHYCGDGIADGDLGEECDLGPLNGQMDQRCDSNCKYDDGGYCRLCL